MPAKIHRTLIPLGIPILRHHASHTDHRSTQRGGITVWRSMTLQIASSWAVRPRALSARVTARSGSPSVSSCRSTSALSPLALPPTQLLRVLMSRTMEATGACGSCPAAPPVASERRGTVTLGVLRNGLQYRGVLSSLRCFGLAWLRGVLTPLDASVACLGRSETLDKATVPTGLAPAAAQEPSASSASRGALRGEAFGDCVWSFQPLSTASRSTWSS